jgi:hypothetical protein
MSRVPSLSLLWFHPAHVVPFLALCCSSGQRPHGSWLEDPLASGFYTRTNCQDLGAAKNRPCCLIFPFAFGCFFSLFFSQNSANRSFLSSCTDILVRLDFEKREYAEVEIWNLLTLCTLCPSLQHNLHSNLFTFSNSSCVSKEKG